MNYHQMQEENNYPRAFGIAGGIMGIMVVISFFIMIVPLPMGDLNGL